MSTDKSKPTADDVAFFPGVQCYQCEQPITAVQSPAAVPVHGGEPDDHGMLDIIAWLHGDCAEYLLEDKPYADPYDEAYYREMSDAYAEAMEF